MKIPKWLLRIGQALLVVAVTYGIVRALAPELGRVSLSDFARWKPHIGLLLLSTVMLVGMYLIHSLLWRIITTRLGGVQPNPRATLRIYFISSMGRYIPGKLWQIAGMAMLAQKAGVSAVAATAASLVGQFAFLTTGLVYLALLLPGWGGWAPTIAAAVTLLVGAGAFFVITSTRLGHQARAWLTRRFGERFGNALMLLDRVRWQDAVVWWLCYAVTWALLGAAFVVFVMSFVPLQGLHVLVVAGTVAAAYLSGYVAFFSFAGLGIREGVMLVLLSHVMPGSAALVVSVASRVWFTAAEVLPLAMIPFAPGEERP